MRLYGVEESRVMILTSHDFREEGRLHWRAIFQEIGTHHVDLHVFEAGEGTAPDDRWQDEKPVAIFAVKWDGCAHVGFRDEGLGRNWVHVCGPAEMARVLRMLQWGWNLCAEKLAELGFDDEDAGPIDVVKGAE